MTNRIAVAAFFSVLICCTSANAEVFKWKDDNGVVHYSSKRNSEQARPADLPHITRADVKIPTSGLESCSKHGGIDCQAGSDTDGSVICVDGFTGASTRYRFHCNTPKLSISEVSDRTPKGTYKIALRNAKPVAANKVSLFFQRPDGKEVPLSGPSEVEPFGTAEYVLDKADAEGLVNKPSTSKIRLVCSNCP